MNIFQTLTNSPTHHQQIYSPKTQIGSYQEYFQRRLRQKQFQRSKNKSSSKYHHSKSKSKVPKNKDIKSKKSPELKKKKKQQFKVDSMYASRISQMLSQISIPTENNKITKQQLRNLQNRIIKQILSLRQQKILALQNLNKVIDKKNKAIQLTKSLQVLKETSRLNTNDSDQQDDNQIEIQFSKFQKNSIKQDVNTYTHNSRLSKNNQSRLSKKSKAPKQLINSKLQQQVKQIQNTLNQAGKIREQLMRPLYEHPLVQKNKQLKQEYEQLKVQVQMISFKSSQAKQQVNSLKQQNQQLLKQLQRQKSKLSSIQNKRFQTFFPKDKLKIDQMSKLVDTFEHLQMRKAQLEQDLMNGTIIRRAEDEIVLEQLRQQNKYLQQSCERILIARQNNQIDYQYSHMSIEQLQQLVNKQMQNKKLVNQMLNQFRNKINDLERQNQNLMKNKPRISYYY